MAGYRDRSNFDPMAYETPGRPLRPYNWVQWIGVVMIATGTLYAVAFLLGAWDFIPIHFKSILSFALLPLIGQILVNSRREPGTPVADADQLRRNRQVLLITVLVCAVILGAATVTEFTGA